MQIAFDHTIASTLSTDQLWHLLVQSFRNSDESPDLAAWAGVGVLAQSRPVRRTCMYKMPGWIAV